MQQWIDGAAQGDSQSGTGDVDAGVVLSLPGRLGSDGSSYRRGNDPVTLLPMRIDGNVEPGYKVP